MMADLSTDSEKSAIIDEFKSKSNVEDLTSESHSEIHSDEENTDEHEADEGIAHSPSHRFHPGLTGRGVTIATLMTEDIIQPGEKVMSLEYLGQRFVADLLNDGRICDGHGQMFHSPSAWAIHCKQIVNPGRRSGCGWASVRYKGKKLDVIKSAYVRKHNPIQPPNYTNLLRKPTDQDSLSLVLDTVNRNTAPSTLQSPGSSSVTHFTETSNHSLTDVSTANLPEVPLNLCGMLEPTNPTSSLSPAMSTNIDQPSISHSSLPTKDTERNGGILVECTTFSSLGKIQPFIVSASCTSLLLMDLHSHLSTAEVCGYLGGRWDPSSQELQIAQVFPCLCNISQQNNAPVIEEQIRQTMINRGLSLVGWYHSHPFTQPDPSLNDIETQMDNQLQLKGYGNSYHPCVAIIISPYGMKDGSLESTTRAYWVMPPPEHKPNEFGKPMKMSLDVDNDVVLTQDFITDVKRVCDWYLEGSGNFNLNDLWQGQVSYWNKIQGSLKRYLPADHVDGKLLDFVLKFLTAK